MCSRLASTARKRAAVSSKPKSAELSSWPALINPERSNCVGVSLVWNPAPLTSRSLWKLRLLLNWGLGAQGVRPENFSQAAPGFPDTQGPTPYVSRAVMWDSKGKDSSSCLCCLQDMACTGQILTSVCVHTVFHCDTCFVLLDFRNSDFNCLVFPKNFFQSFMVLQISSFMLRKVFHCFIRLQIVAGS